MKLNCRECQCGENELLERGYYTFHRGTDAEYQVCIPCREGDDPIHLVCRCNTEHIVGPHGHKPGCHVEAHLKKLIPVHATGKTPAPEKQ